MNLYELNEKKIIIFGAGRIASIAIMVLRDFQKDIKCKLLGCAISLYNHNPTVLEGIPVREIDEYHEEFEDATFLVAVRDEYYPSAQDAILKRKIKNVVRFDIDEHLPMIEERWKKEAPERANKFIKSGGKRKVSKEEYALFLAKQLKKNVVNFEINVAEHCNLNCQSCNHFSPLASPEFLDLESYEQDIIRLKELLGVDNTGKIMLLGGEPLLHPQIETVMEMTRKHFPKSEITIVSNGLLLPKMTSKFWKLLASLPIGLTITKYPVNFDYSKWEKEAEKKGIKFSDGLMTEPIKTTYHLPFYDDERYDPYINYMKCYHSNQCVVLRKGRMYTCPQAANMHYFNDFFGKDIPCEEEVSISLYDTENWEEIEEYLKLPNKMCSHCGIFEYTYDIPWARSKKDITEWTK